MKQLSLHVTDACNSRCSFCVVGSPLTPRDTVRFADLIGFLTANAGQGYQSVNLHGGEPTVHPRLMELLDVINLLEYPEVHIQTNGRRLKDLEFTRALVQRGVRLFVISLHGFRPETQDAIAQVTGGFDETIAGIGHAKQLGAAVRTNTVLTRRNAGELGDLVDLCRRLGVDHVNISNLHPVGSGYFAIDAMAQTVGEMRGCLLPIVARLVAAGTPVTLEGFPFCTITPYEDLALEWETRDIRMMYQGAVFDNYDAYMDRHCRSFGPPCRTCEYRGLCGGVYPEYSERRGWSEFSPVTAAIERPATPCA